MNRTGRILLVALTVLVLSGWLAARIQTDGGAIQLQSIKLPAQNGQWVVADLFRPRSATADNPAPFIVVIPGFQRSKEALSNVAIELARRGFVTASIDPYAQGSSSASLSRMAATTEGYGLFALVDYAASSENLNYIDRTKIGAGAPNGTAQQTRFRICLRLCADTDGRGHGGCSLKCWCRLRAPRRRRLPQ
jgi:hypothetical protein